MANQTSYQRMYKCRWCGAVFDGEITKPGSNPYKEAQCIHRCIEGETTMQGLGDFVGLHNLTTNDPKVNTTTPDQPSQS